MPPRKSPAAKPTVSPLQSIYFNHHKEQQEKYGPKTIVLFQVGSFYEVYDTIIIETGECITNAQQIAELCGSAVQPKPSSDPKKQTFFWGFPESALEKYEPIITAAGYTVVVISQKKNAMDEVESRNIDHVSSPGIYNGSIGMNTVRREEQIMLSVYVEPYTDIKRKQNHWYIASTAFDVSTGRSVSTESDLILIDNKPVLDILTPFWSVYPPAEVCFYWSSLSEPPSSQRVSSMFAGTATGKPPLIHIYKLDPVKESAVTTDRIRLHYLQNIFKCTSALSVEEYLGITYYNYARRSLYKLLQFVEDHNPSYLRMLHEHRIWTPEDNVLLGNAALEQLGMLPTSNDKEHESLLSWLQKATTAMGRRTLRERLLKPIADIAELEHRQERIASLRTSPKRDLIEQTLRGSHDLARVHRKIQLGTNTTDDLLQLLSTYEKALKLADIIKDEDYTSFDNINDIVAHISSITDVFDIERIRKSKEQITSNEQIVFGSAHPWRSGLYPELDAIETEWLNCESDAIVIKNKLNKILGETDAINWDLRDDAPFTFTTTQRRISLLTKHAPSHGIFDIVTTKKTAAIHIIESSELQQLNKKAASIRNKWRVKIYEQWLAFWTTWVDKAITNGSLDLLVDWIGELDTECTLARLSNLYGYERPRYIECGDAAGFEAKGLRHPIIERIHSTTPYVSHNIAFGPFSGDCAENTASAELGVLLYGVNAAGKSSLGKAIGLSVIMAQTGMPVPASSFTIMPYTGIFTRILGNDNLWAGMSSFVVEMTEFRSILRSANSKTLVIGDELCAGTETASAASIVSAGIKTLADKGANFFFATHLHELQDIPEVAEHPKIKSYHLTVRPSPTHHGALIYDRHICEGTGSAMYGLEVCRGLDMDSDFLETAFNMRKKYFSNDKIRISRYNASVTVSTCTICGCNEGLETHHIVPQADANSDGMIGAGWHKNNKNNLVVLCEKCHLAHHQGRVNVIGWINSTRGPLLNYTWDGVPFGHPTS